MKQVVALLGSRRKKNTYHLLMEIQSILNQHQIELHIVFLCKENIKPCLGCEQCILKGNCVLPDGAADVMQLLEEADGIILASPVYLRQVCGEMKTYFDRTCVWYHRPALAAKPVLAVATTKGSGLKKTLAYLESMAVQWGAVPAGRVGRSIFNQEKPVSQKEIQHFIALLQQPQDHVPTLNQLLNFQVQKAMALSLNRLDREYWEAHNWHKASYFYPCRVNPLYRWTTASFGKLLLSKMKSPQKQEERNSTL